jgi:hypothetical protein
MTSYITERLVASRKEGGEWEVSGNTARIVYAVQCTRAARCGDVHCYSTAAVKLN